MFSMARILFTVFGKPISIKNLLQLALVIAAGVALWFVYSAIKSHFDHIRDLEKTNTQLTQDKTKLEGQKSELIRINGENAKTSKTSGEQKAASTEIANEEAKTSTNRTIKTKEIKHAIDQAPATVTPVDPVITDTLGSLWK